MRFPTTSFLGAIIILTLNVIATPVPANTAADIRVSRLHPTPNCPDPQHEYILSCRTVRPQARHTLLAAASTLLAASNPMFPLGTNTRLS